MIAIVYVLVNFVVDILYTVLDPRIRHARAARLALRRARSSTREQARRGLPSRGASRSRPSSAVSRAPTAAAARRQEASGSARGSRSAGSCSSSASRDPRARSSRSTDPDQPRRTPALNAPGTAAAATSSASTQRPRHAVAPRLGRPQLRSMIGVRRGRDRLRRRRDPRPRRRATSGASVDTVLGGAVRHAARDPAARPRARPRRVHQRNP